MNFFSLVVPTFNEKDNILPLLGELKNVLSGLGMGYEIIVVDDDSPDLTWQVVQDALPDFAEVKLIRRINKRGLATAVVDGWKNSSGNILGVIDGDCQHDPGVLKNLLEAIRGGSADIVLASRRVSGGGLGRWGWGRRMISKTATLMAQLILPVTLRKISDPMTGYFAFRKEVVDIDALNPMGYKISIEVLAQRKKSRVKEVPLVFRTRQAGDSKIGKQVYVEFVKHLLKICRATGEWKKSPVLVGAIIVILAVIFTMALM